MLGASHAVSATSVGPSVVERPLSLQPFELLEQSGALLPLGQETSSLATNETLFRFAVLSDTHFWLPSTARAEWSRQSNEASMARG